MTVPLSSRTATTTSPCVRPITCMKSEIASCGTVTMPVVPAPSGPSHAGHGSLTLLGPNEMLSSADSTVDHA